jgi:hypothetical protein
VHWVARQEGAASADEAVELSYAWGERKRMFTAEQIHSAWKALSEHRWIEVRDS